MHASCARVQRVCETAETSACVDTSRAPAKHLLPAATIRLQCAVNRAFQCASLAHLAIDFPRSDRYRRGRRRKRRDLFPRRSDFKPVRHWSQRAAHIDLHPPRVVYVIGDDLLELQKAGKFHASCGELLFRFSCYDIQTWDDVDAAVIPVIWGEVSRMGSQFLGHCCFTSQGVVDVDPTRKYACSKPSCKGGQT